MWDLVGSDGSRVDLSGGTIPSWLSPPHVPTCLIWQHAPAKTADEKSADSANAADAAEENKPKKGIALWPAAARRLPY